MNTEKSAQTTSKRISGFELLRIISMILITLHHITMTYGLESPNYYIRIWAQFLYIGGKVGVNCFVLLSSWFLIDKPFDIRRIFRVHRQVFFYSIMIFAVGFVAIPNTIDFSDILKSFLPVIFNHYWFLTTYIGLLLIAPFLNMFLKSASKRRLKLLILIGSLLFTLIPTFTAQTPFNDNLSWFAFLYILAAYFKKYDTRVKKLLGTWYVFPCAWIFIFFTSVVMTIFERVIPQLSEGINFFSGMYILPQLINSVSLFLLCERSEIKSDAVNWIGKHTVASYLIQSNCVLIPIRIMFLNVVFTSFPVFLYPILSVLVAFFMLFLGVGCNLIYEWFSKQDMPRKWECFKEKEMKYLVEKCLEALR